VRAPKAARSPAVRCVQSDARIRRRPQRVYALEMTLNSYGRVVQLAVFVVAGVLLFVATSSAERGRPPKKPVCTHGASSIGPIYLHDGKAVGRIPTAHTETCLR
jgi:hypothetical protein